MYSATTPTRDGSSSPAARRGRIGGYGRPGVLESKVGRGGRVHCVLRYVEEVRSERRGRMMLNGYEEGCGLWGAHRRRASRNL